MIDDGDKRQEQRLSCHETTFIEVVSATMDAHQPGKIVVCNTMDVSANGLQLGMDEPLMIGGIHQLSIQLDKTERHYHLVGEIKWCRSSNGDSAYIVGMALFESDDTDIQAWKEAIATRYD